MMDEARVRKKVIEGQVYGYFREKKRKRFKWLKRRLTR